MGGATPYALDGRRIDLALSHREISRVKALGQGKANGADWRLTADTIDLRVERHKLQQAFAWGDSLRPHAISTMQTFDADSLAIDSPDQVLTELRGFGGAFSTSKRDSTPNPDVDWIAGDTLTAHWIQEHDSAGKSRAALQRILSHGSARSLTHMYDDQNKTAPPSLNYSRGKSIAIALLHSRIDRVVVGGRADGVQLEPRPVPRDTTKADSSKADSTRRPSRPPRGRP